MNEGQPGFRIALFGAPGAGKTTAAQSLSRRNDNVFWIEASRDLIEAREYANLEPFDVRSKRGPEYFARAVASEGEDWAAQRALRAAGSFSHLIVTGIRGVHNLRTLKAAGFFCVFFECRQAVTIARLVQREGITPEQALAHLQREQEAFDHLGVHEESDFVIDTSEMSPFEVEGALFNLCMTASPKHDRLHIGTTCRRCANPRSNDSLFTRDADVCDICLNFAEHHAPDTDKGLLAELLADIGPSGTEKAILGFSGGKDSTNVCDFLLGAHARFETFTVDTGYYPLTMLARARHWAGKKGLQHLEIDARKFMDASTRESYRLTAEFYQDLRSMPPERALLAYNNSRKLYSVKHTQPSAFPRVCVLCRKSVIKSYYDAATSRDAKYVILGLNEWANLSCSCEGSRQFSGFRRIAPDSGSKPVYIVHLPFVLNFSLTKVEANLAQLGWSLPFGEDVVESNSNSCLLAKAAEADFCRYVGFHPDSTRLSREVTVGFLRRGDAIQALSHISSVPWTVRDTLEYAGILPRD